MRSSDQCLDGARLVSRQRFTQRTYYDVIAGQEVSKKIDLGSRDVLDGDPVCALVRGGDRPPMRAPMSAVIPSFIPSTAGLSGTVRDAEELRARMRDRRAVRIASVRLLRWQIRAGPRRRSLTGRQCDVDDQPLR